MAHFFYHFIKAIVKKNSHKKVQNFSLGAIQLSEEQFRTFLDGFGLFLIHKKVQQVHKTNKTGWVS